LIEIAGWLWRRLFFDINIGKYGFPYCDPSWATRPWFEETWIYIMSESFHVNMTYSGSVVLEKKIFKCPNPIFEFLWLSLLWRVRKRGGFIRFLQECRTMASKHAQ
jgi:hypothetical protein